VEKLDGFNLTLLNTLLKSFYKRLRRLSSLQKVLMIRLNLLEK
jgi:hypothetical protein